jgi:hypothetical protein
MSGKKPTKLKTKEKETLELIEMVHGQPALWDLQHELYKDPDAKRRKWHKIAEDLGLEGYKFY